VRPPVPEKRKEKENKIAKHIKKQSLENMANTWEKAVKRNCF
jgi:hypothetical protein